ncbi:MAG: T9SS type A sorting domain-containing protein, partial [Deinococcales bacterium]|nr:T9SS type A sorting domain-containing protein [Chitinophagaceae bacterium]
IWKRIYDKMQAVAPSSYCILEHFADNSEEVVLADYGMLLWGNLNHNYQQATMGYTTDWDLSGTVAVNRGWSQPNLIGYQESHDEERLMFQNINYGNINGSYNTKTLSTATKRMAMSAALWSMIPGPKMLWQFGELGYDFSINYCNNGTINTNCRTDPKPVKWDYYQNADRKGLYDVYAKLLNLRTSPLYTSTFTTGDITSKYSLTSAVKQLRVIDPNLSVVAFGNFDVSSQFSIITFPNGTWYNYLNPSAGSITITSGGLPINLQPGEYYVYTSKDANTAILPVTWLSFVVEKALNNVVNLQWMVTNQVNNDHYEVERSTNGVNFTNIGSVASNNTTQGSTVTYNFVDKQPISGTVYYRIKQVDKDGKYSYSIVQTITVSTNEAALWQVYPTISTNGTSTALHLKRDVGKIQVILTDVSGKIVYQVVNNTTSIGQLINIPLTNRSKGIYMLKIVTDKAQSTEKIIVQ